jgi:methylglyoxal/glyoxal reductase
MSVHQAARGKIGLGTYRLGEETIFACLKALEIGYRHIDTASLYRNEKQVAKAIEQSGLKREEIFVTSKIKVADLQSEHLELAVCRSLENLKRIDLLILHAPTKNLVDVWKQMLEIKQWQEIGDIGVSNFDVCHLQKLEFQLPKWNQIEVTPYLQRLNLVRYCQQKEIQIIAHSPLVKGRKLRCNNLLSIAQSIQVSPSQLLIAWSLAKGYLVLPRSSQLIHLQENFDAIKVKLSEKILKKLDCLEENYATHPQHISLN